MEWKQFIPKAWRVRSIKDQSYGGRWSLSPHTELCLAMSRLETGPIFPAVQILQLSSRNMSKLFMSQSVRTLHWSIQSYMGTTPILWSQCRSVVDRMPFITTLHLQFDDALALRAPISFLCSMLTNLTTITLPIHTLIEDIICALSGLPRLQSIEMSKEVNLHPSRFHDSDVIKQFDPTRMHIGPHGFPRLEKISFSAPSVEAAMVFLTHHIFHRAQIKDIHVRVPFALGVRGPSVTEMLRALGRYIPLLEKLELWLAPSGTQSTSRIRQMDRLGPEELRNTDCFIHLTVLEVHHAMPLNFNNADMEKLVSGLPSIEILILNPHPVIPRSTRISFTVLSVIAHSCPRIKELGIFVDGLLPFSLPQDTGVFHELRLLRLGRSVLPSISHFETRNIVAQYFASVLPAHTTVRTMDAEYRWDITDYHWTPCATRLTEITISMINMYVCRLREILAIARAVREERQLLQQKLHLLNERLRMAREMGLQTVW